ncbi:putative MFS family arabinose efflux permease [Bradyrhizobium elkanii]|uniref:MFS transporter n=1 Tax=Bradyrhizobium TaxID=374 RepID=UPI000A7F576A|nr:MULTISPECIES: MFS transporter [Bradyrhizobium]MCS3927171.1 putative MFS family arabinose efflux permease [Bradyrhizobium elkanii]MCS3967724.1 putative MFS family arabinose efflux permease [Bradyrhizobium japonicum]
MRQYIDPILHRRRERLVRVIALATFVVFFQAYMVAPIIPVLSNAFGVSDEKIGLVVPAYLIPYGVSTLIYGAVADRIGIARVMFTSLLAFSALTMLTATARSYEELLLWRTITGVGASGIVPLGLALVGRLYPYGQRGRPLGWLFGAMAGGMAFGSPLGALIIPVTNWSGLFIVVGVFGLALLLPWLRYLTVIETTVPPLKGTVYQVFDGYRHLLGTPRGQRTYGYVFLNSMFHSGVFTWLGVYLERRYHLGPAAIGLALLGYGIPGFLLGPLIGRAADRWGRARLIPIGLILSSLAAMALALGTPVMFIPIVAIILSLGYDMTQPLFGGIVTSLGGERAGQAMGLNVFMLFVGFGLGSLIFGALMHYGFTVAFGAFAMIELLIALMSFGLFRSEVILVGLILLCLAGSDVLPRRSPSTAQTLPSTNSESRLAELGEASSNSPRG